MEVPKKILILCGGRFAFKALQLLAYEKYVCGVGIGKANERLADALERECEDNNIAFQSFTNKKSLSNMKDWIEAIEPDYIFSMSFPFLLSEEILFYGPEKFINFHPGPLPQYRGVMPIFEVLKNQEPQTAISVHYMNSKFDEGDLIYSDPVSIDSKDTYGTLTVKLSNRLAQVALNTANMLQFANKIPSIPQDRSKAYYYEKPDLSDTYINWKRMGSDEIIALINACNPWNVGADFSFKGEQAKIVTAKILKEPHNNTLPGTILSTCENGTINVACCDNNQISIEILKTDSGIMTSKQFTASQPVVGLVLN
ncbi:methionyl-tRNA formyltransferase [Flavobacterium sp. SM15]|uniref:methionyl-tRNA formyltransferase n=1 Tax=Flavobacterium sp. SM15 TaxID=2908005 RepID=UPI001EDB18DB|nr:formyltransferase family protein [Flavobacterium sp. SM15]MCG2612573.1 methionyl-tRNA formyltransferase [Flavobacterium sp. SM15]